MEVWRKVIGDSVDVQFAVFFDCSEQCMEARLLERGKTSGRSDDNAESIRKRFRTFIEESTPVAQHLEAKGVLKRIDAEQSVEAVWKSVQATFGPSVVFVLGGPGSGKGTQCTRITSAFGYKHLSAGDLLREERQKPGSAYGELIESHIRAGSLVPAEITVKLLLKAMHDGGWEGGKYLVDGFPRSLNNLEAWNEVVKGQVNVKCCMYIEVCEGVLEARLLERGKTSGRSDDNLDSIRKRFITFHKDSIPVVERFRSEGLLRRIDGELDVEDVWRQVQTVFGPSIVFVAGGPGAGKGTQCSRIAKTFGYTHLSSGDLLREERKRPGSEYGAMIERFIREGKLVPSEVVVGLLKNAMTSSGWEGGKYLIDGFPRGFENLDVWERLLGSTVHVQFCLYFDASEVVMEGRCLQRGQTSGRVDDNLESIRKRFATFREESIPVLQTFTAQGKLRSVDADRGTEEVWADVWRLFAPTVVFMLGGPGTGKGTQCKKVSAAHGVAHGFQHLSVGDLLREEQQRKDSQFGTLIEGYLKEGALVPSKVVLAILRQAMEVRQWVGGRYFIDGLPRNIENLEQWEKELGSKVNVPFSIYFDCSIDTMRSRLLEHSKTSDRLDDTPETIEKRLQNFRSSIPPVLERMQRQGGLRKINAEQGIEEVCGCLQEVMHNELDPHLMNRAMIIVKPRALNPETTRFVQSYLTTHRIAVLHKEVVSKETVAKKDLFAQQYFQILGGAEADPASLEIPRAKQELFQQRHGISWADAVAKGDVVSAAGALQKLGLTSAELFQQEAVAEKPLRLTSTIMVVRLGSVFVVNGFALHWRDTFFEGADSLMWLMVEFDPATLSWEKFRSDILGTTDPAEAPKESIRGQLYEHWQALGMKERPTKLYNGVHASAGPLEALHERITWTSIKLEDDPFGRLLLSSGIPKATVNAWIENPSLENWHVGHEVRSGPIFDCSKACNTSVFRDSALRYAKDVNMALNFWPVSNTTSLRRPSVQIDSTSSPSRTGRLPKAMTILHFNDVYNVEPRNKEPVGGIARFVTRVQELRQEAVARGEEEAVVLFSGDAFNPSITSTTTRGTHMVPALNAIGIHTACFGNHDFDFGVDHLVELSQKNNFPWLISNVFDKRTGRPLADGVATQIMDFHGRKIGLLGLVEKEWLVTLATIEPGDIDYEDFCPCGQRLARQLKEQGCEIVIALTHMRMPNDFLLAHEVAEVDIILGGHDHHYEVHPEGPYGTYVLNSGTDFRDLTEVRIEFADQPGPRPFKVASTRHVEIDSSIAEDPEMRVLVDQCQGEVSAMMDVVLGETAVDLDSRFASIRTQETNIGNFVADVMRNALKTDLAVINSGTLRADSIIEKGPIKMRDLVSLLPMLDELCILQTSGNDILRILENSVSQYPRLEGRFAQVSGVTFTFDASKPSGARLLRESIKIGGAPLDLGRSYKLCTKDYLRQGKDGYDVFREVVCLADGEQAGILPTVVRDSFQEISTLNGLTDSCPHDATHHAEKVLSALSLERVGDGPDLMKSYAIAPKVEGRIVCLNPVAT